MKNLHEYDQEKFQSQFETTETFKKLKQIYRDVFFDKFLESRYTAICTTPRHHLSLGWASAVPWYYLDYLDTDTELVDIGCGMNYFKPFFPNVIGIGAEDRPECFFGDTHDFVDNDFYQGHIQAFKSVISVNALHFHPLENLRNICIKYSQMIKPSGCGFLALNLARMHELSSTLKHLKKDDLENWVRQQFDDFPCKIAVLDIDFSVYDAWLDGNIRVVFKK